MMTIAMIDNDRRPMAFDAFFEGMPSSDKLPAIIWQNYLQACRYAQGDLPPRYPVPCTDDYAVTAIAIDAINWNEHMHDGCGVCIDDWLDTLSVL